MHIDGYSEGLEGSVFDLPEVDEARIRDFLEFIQFLQEFIHVLDRVIQNDLVLSLYRIGGIKDR